ncbi:hypothetical protein MKZ38_003431 [Zalerion maritima]|uniref:Uncharacterized protein n=1 Tax=Zalerion maritima TaxID=339359 RepID=A0AAD5RMN7_9PEZI|nr:hypothetical protein MKZ38_003431 [Zalerion maritima]
MRLLTIGTRMGAGAAMRERSMSHRQDDRGKRSQGGGFGADGNLLLSSPSISYPAVNVVGPPIDQMKRRRHLTTSPPMSAGRRKPCSSIRQNKVKETQE